MEFERFTALPYEIHKGKYTANPEIADRILEELANYIHQRHRNPAYLLLGFGTYFSLCITVSKQRHQYNNYCTSGMVEELTHFQGIPILIDSGYEFRVSCIGEVNPFQDAVNTYFENRNTK